MATGTSSPDPWLTLLDDNGNIIPGGKLFTYLSGTTTKVATYTDSGLTTPNANPIILDSAGRCIVYLTPGVAYKYVLSPSTDTDPPTNPIKTADPIFAVPPFLQNVDIAAVAGENLSSGDLVYQTSGAGVDAGRTTGRWYKTDQTFSERSANAGDVGFTTAAITTGNTGSVRIGGLVTGLSALTVKQLYFTSTTPGAISSTFLNQAERPVGVAYSTTELLLLFPSIPSLLANTHTDGTQQQGDVATVAQTWSGVKTFLSPPIFSPGTVASAATTAVVSGVLKANVTAVTQASASELDLITYSVPANTLSANGKMLRATMWGENSGAGAGNRTYRAYFGASVITLPVLATTGTEWRIVFEIIRTGSATEIANVSRISTAVMTDLTTAFAADTTVANTLKLTVQGAGATDGGTQEALILEVVG